jgi:hemerythrin-like metal-binding protein
MVDVPSGIISGKTVSHGALRSVEMPWLPGSQLPPELNTGYADIDQQHRQLASSIAAVRRVCSFYSVYDSCSNCAEATRARCESDLVSLLGDLLAFVLEHFQQEERIMRESFLLQVDRDICEAHMEDHANISSKIQQIVSAIDKSQTITLLRQLDVLLQRWMSNHVALHDLLVARLIERGDTLDKACARSA